MPLHEILLFALAVGAALIVATQWRPDLRLILRRARTWVTIGSVGALASLASAGWRQTGYAGERIVTRFGWPKSFAMAYHDETGRALTDVSLPYFLANALFHAAAALALLAAWRLLRGRG